MSERRTLVEGLKQTPAVDPELEKAFVFNSKGLTEGEGAAPKAAAPPTLAVAATIARAPISTRIRADYATALKRASLERQLNNTEPSTLQDILEQAIEPWLKANGYLQ